MPIGALGGALAEAQSIYAALESKFHLVTCESTWSINNYSNDPLDGPVLVGYAHSDYTDAEIAEALDTVVLSPGNKIEQEKNRRLVRVVGTMAALGSATTVVGNMELNDGKPIKTKLNWTINEGDSVNMFAFNQGSATILTGAVLNVGGTQWGYWK